MAVAMTSGDVWVAHVLQVTTSADLAGKSLITAGGAAASNASAGVFGVIAKDTPSGDVADVKIAPSIVEVIATGTVTAGNMVEVLQGTVNANINGTSTSTTSAGVTNLASGYPVGKALTSSDVYGTVLVALIVNQVKSA